MFTFFLEVVAAPSESIKLALSNYNSRIESGALILLSAILWEKEVVEITLVDIK